MLKEFWEIAIVEGPLAPPPLAFSAESGGVVEFYGVVRGTESQERIAAIRYEAFLEMASHQLEKLSREAAAKFPIHGLLLHHRIGLVPAGEPSLFLRVSAKHRAAAFEATQWVIVQLKAAAPIWKHPLTAGGREVEQARTLP